MGPKAGGEPMGELATAIVKDFGSIDDFKKQFVEAGMQRFGSGWVWLAITRKGNLAISSTQPRQSPHGQRHPHPRQRSLGARLLPHLSKPPRRIFGTMVNVVNWNAVNDRYNKAIA